MANEYAQLSELKEMRSITGTSQDAALQRAIERASRAIDRRCGVPDGNFLPAGAPTARTISPYGRTIYRHGSDTLLTDDIADGATVSVTVGGQAVSADTLTMVTGTPGGPVTGITRASWYGGTIVVTANWGWPALPVDIEQATLLLANRRYMRKDSPEGTSGWAQEGAIGVSRYDQDIEDLIAPFVRYGFGG